MTRRTEGLLHKRERRGPGTVQDSETPLPNRSPVMRSSCHATSR